MNTQELNAITEGAATRQIRELCDRNAKNRAATRRESDASTSTVVRVRRTKKCKNEMRHYKVFSPVNV